MFMIQETHAKRGYASLVGVPGHGVIARNDQNGDVYVALNNVWTKITDGTTGAVIAAVVTQGQTIPLQNSAGTVSAGNAGLNSPATLLFTAGALTSVRAAP